jgi:hypothetical protein
MMRRKQVTVPSDDEDVCFVLDQHAYIHFYSVGSHCPDSKLTSLCSYFLMFIYAISTK